MTAEDIWAELLEGNRRFVAGAPQQRDLVRERQLVAESQKPKAVVLTCFDSRVVPETIFDQRLGDLLVVRVAGHVADKVAIGSLELAVEYLGVPLLLVIGHQHCAAVKTAHTSQKVNSSNLKAIIKAVRSSSGFAGFEAGDEQAMRAAEMQNARHVASSVVDCSNILRERVERGALSIIAAYYRLDSGVVERL
ncbi:MAG: carbonic anhydrase [Terriglobales bacterium]